MSCVSLLMPMNGENNSSVFLDKSSNPKPVIPYGNVKLSTNQSKFGGSSAYFDGSGDYLEISDNSIFNMGAGDFTIEAWVYINSNSVPDRDGSKNAAIISTWSSSTLISGYVFAILGNNTTTGIGISFDSWLGGNSTQYKISNTITQQTWHHIAACVNNGVRKIFLNGVLQTGGTTNIIGYGENNFNTSSGVLTIGMRFELGIPFTIQRLHTRFKNN